MQGQYKKRHTAHASMYLVELQVDHCPDKRMPGRHVASCQHEIARMKSMALVLPVEQLSKHSDVFDSSAPFTRIQRTPQAPIKPCRQPATRRSPPSTRTPRAQAPLTAV
eukprot:2534268-Rhodomonas_salina.1